MSKLGCLLLVFMMVGWRLEMGWTYSFCFLSVWSLWQLKQEAFVHTHLFYLAFVQDAFPLKLNLMLMQCEIYQSRQSRMLANRAFSLIVQI